MKVLDSRTIALILLLTHFASAQDRLQPEVSIMYAAQTSYDYCKNINILFFDNTPSDYLARMFCRPGYNKPQWCVTIYEDKEHKHTVQYIEAEKWIDHRKDSLGIKVKRLTQPIDSETAQIVQVVIRRMLRSVRYPDREKEGGDGDEFAFSRNVLGMVGFDRKPGDPPPGSEQGLIYEPDDGTLTKKLVNIGEAMKLFALADSQVKRDMIRADIRRKAEELEAKLGSTIDPK